MLHWTSLASQDSATILVPYNKQEVGKRSFQINGQGHLRSSRSLEDWINLNICWTAATSEGASRAQDPSLDIMCMFDGLNEAAMKLAFNLPVPDWLIPG